MDISSWWERLYSSEQVSGFCSSVVAEVEICAVFKDQLRLKAALWTGPGMIDARRSRLRVVGSGEGSRGCSLLCWDVFGRGGLIDVTSGCLYMICI